jgi:choline dehydrogenase-like flavoprotein
MPQLPRVNPQATCYAMGWRLGEILAKEHETQQVASR